MASITVFLSLTEEMVKKHYSGELRHIMTQSRDGRRVQLPATVIRQIYRSGGINGWYRVHFDSTGKMLSIEPLMD